MIILLDHDYRFFGASIYLLYLYKKLQDFQVMYFIPHKPIISLSIPFIIYNNNLIEKIKEINPKLIYINCLNKEIESNWDYLKKYNIIFHSHDKYCYFVKPDFVVSDIIASYYDNVKIQKPFILDEKIDEIYNFRNQKRLYQNDKIIIGMCGEISDRKNFKLFNQITKLFPQYYFIWLGGNKDEKITSNFIIKKYEQNPYLYFHSFDYLLFTGIDDPCPYVILENIILETPILLFKNSVLTNFSIEIIKYIDENINIKSMIKSIYYNVNRKKKNIGDDGYEYIKNNFSSADNILKEINVKMHTLMNGTSK